MEGLESALADGAALVDVREPEEYVEAHVPGAVLVPMDQLAARIDELPKDEPVYLICRSAAAARRSRSSCRSTASTRSTSPAAQPPGSGPASPYDQGM